MRLESYLKESSPWTEYEKDLPEIFDIIRKNCMPAINDMRKNRVLFWRGLMSEANMPSRKNYLVKTVRQDRKPKDMPVEIQEMLDDKFEKKFGWKPRSTGAFASISYKGAHFPKYLFFPFGKYTYVYSKTVKDLYLDLRDEFYREAGDSEAYWEGFHDYDEQSEEGYDIIKRAIDNLVGTYTDKNLKSAGAREIMFNIPSRKYLSVHERMASYITKEFKIIVTSK